MRHNESYNRHNEWYNKHLPSESAKSYFYGKVRATGKTMLPAGCSNYFSVVLIHSCTEKTEAGLP
ncbi:hypothetical protein QF042_001637 [Pedobacter sp. W3I1]|uniref:hypothetical protein n=1 Tax=Pedobacter sp. W3I1 TaxID=3042291 RepID=UPI002783989A|nr:hypothetical protein [Pedobacter sp. W3I1]MDQ0638072.1 hypothetical protein [Pedobacter sp. W3I1]